VTDDSGTSISDGISATGDGGTAAANSTCKAWPTVYAGGDGDKDLLTTDLSGKKVRIVAISGYCVGA